MTDPQNGKITLPAWMTETNKNVSGKAKTGFLRRTIQNISQVFKNDLYSETYASKAGLLQAVDPCAKILAFLILMIFSGCTSSITTLIVLTAVPLFYGAASGIPMKDFFRRVWLTIPLIVLLFSLLGTSSLFLGGQPLFYLIPPRLFGSCGGMYFTAEGIAAAFRIALRTGISISFAALLLMTTRWQQVIGAFAAMHLSKTAVAVLDMAYRYIFFLSESASEMFEACFLRTIGKISARESRRRTGGSVAILLLKSYAVGDEVYDAMRCRGYNGDFRRLRKSHLCSRDMAFLGINLILLIFLSLIR
jgi:cobalt/nickel transport system permease protein